MNFRLTCLTCGQGNRVPDAKLGSGPKCGTCGAALLQDRPADISYDILQKAARIDDLPLIVDFWAGWCGPCKMMAPEFAKASLALRGRVRCAKLDTEIYQQAGSRYGIRGIPLLIAFRSGQEIKRNAGAMSAAQILDWAAGLDAR